MDVVGPLVGVDYLQIHHVPDDVVLVHDPVATKHVPGGPGNVERLTARVPLDQANLVRDEVAVLVLEAADPEASLQPN